MAYDFHIVRSKEWQKAASTPISKADTDALIAVDAELQWSSEFIDMRDPAGAVTRYPMIEWNGKPCFWWYRDQILATAPDEAQQWKLVRMARALNAHLVGDDGERYELRTNFEGQERIVTIAAAA
jgi:hypothetical protein